MVLIDQRVLHYHLEVKKYFFSYLINEFVLECSMNMLYLYNIFSKIFLYKLIDEQIFNLLNAQFANQDNI